MRQRDPRVVGARESLERNWQHFEHSYEQSIERATVQYVRHARKYCAELRTYGDTADAGVHICVLREKSRSILPSVPKSWDSKCCPAFGPTLRSSAPPGLHDPRP